MKLKVRYSFLVSLFLLISVKPAPAEADHAASPHESGRPEASCKSYPLGQAQAWRHQENVVESSFSADGTHVATASTDGTVKLINLHTGQQLREINHSGPVNDVRYSFNGNYIGTASDDKTARIIESASGRLFRQISHEAPIKAIRFSRDGRLVATASTDGVARITDVSRGKLIRMVRQGKAVEDIRFSPDGRYVASGSQDGTVKIVNLQNGNETNLSISGPVKMVRYSPDGRFLAVAGADKEAHLFSAPDGKEIAKFSSEDEINGVAFSMDGKYLATASSDKTARVYDLRSKKEIRRVNHQGPVNSVDFSPDDKLVSTSSADGTAKVSDVGDSREILDVPHGVTVNNSQFSPDGKRVISVDEDGLVRSVPIATACVDSNLFVKLEEKDLKSPRSKDPAIERLCSRDFSSKVWDPLTPASFSGPLSRKTAEKYLWRFQKPGGFNPEKHLPILLAILKSKLVDLDADLVGGALETVLSTSNQLYETLLAQFPKLKDLNPTAPVPLCRTKAEVDNSLAWTYHYLLYLNKAAPREKTDLNYFKQLSPLKSNLARLDWDRISRIELVDMSAKMAHTAKLDPRFQGVAESKLVYFGIEALKPFFGQAKSERTDFTLARTPTSIRPVLLGAKELNHDPATLTPFGFYASVGKPIALDKDLSQKNISVAPNGEVAWTHGDKRYVARVKVSRKPNEVGLLPPLESLDYKAMKKDGALTSIVLLGSNRRNRPDIMGEYFKYYVSNGYHFDKKWGHLKDTKEFLEKMVSKEGDLFIPEAHGAGDEKNFIQYDTRMPYLKGVKRLPDGTSEVVYLLYPYKTKQPSRMLSNREFGKWAENRKNLPALALLDKRCWSFDKAIYEWEAATISKLIPYPIVSPAYPLINQPTSMTKRVLDAIYRGEPNAIIEKEAKKSERYRLFGDDHLLVPGTKEYDKLLEYLKYPLNIDIRIKDSAGAEYNQAFAEPGTEKSRPDIVPASSH